MPVNLDLTSLVNSSVKPVAEKISTTISSIWSITFGPIEYAAKKRKLLYAAQLEEFEHSIAKKIHAIPPKDLMEPDFHVIGPVIESSKYYFTEETIREMFANLVAASMNKSASTLIHASFVEMIKQMNPQDATLLREFRKTISINVVEYYLRNRDHTTIGMFSPLYVLIELDPSGEKTDELSRSVDNLQRLGLCVLSMSNCIPRGFDRNIVYNHPSFKKLESTQSHIEHTETPIVDFHFYQLFLTSLGRAFLSVCLPVDQ